METSESLSDVSKSQSCAVLSEMQVSGLDSEQKLSFTSKDPKDLILMRDEMPENPDNIALDSSSSFPTSMKIRVVSAGKGLEKPNDLQQCSDITTESGHNQISSL